jgi:signal transduction histidine kinase
VAAIPPDIRKTLVRTIAAGAAAALLAPAAIWIVARERTGADNRAALARVQSDVQSRVSSGETLLAGLTSRAASDLVLIRSAQRDPASAQQLFDRLAAALPADAEATTGVTIYDVTAAPLAWAGRVVDLPRAQLDASPVVFMASDALGPRLVRVVPILDTARGASPQPVGFAVAETLLPAIEESQGTPLSITPAVAGASSAGAPSGTDTFSIRAANSSVLATARTSPAELSAARGRWRRAGQGAALAVLALTLIACVAPLVEIRRRMRGSGVMAGTTVALFGVVAFTRGVVGAALGAAVPPNAREPYLLIANALTLAAVVWLALDLAERRRLTRTRLRLTSGAVAVVWAAVVYFSAGAVDAAIIWAYENFLRRFVNAAGLDLLHFSLHPLGAGRAAISFALVLLHAGVIWTGALVFRVAALSRRQPRRAAARTVALAACGAGLAAGAFGASRVWGAAPLVPIAVAIVATIACAAALSRPRGAFRRASQTARLGLLYLAIVIPALALYPTLVTYVTAAKERVVAGTFAPEAINLREDMRRQSDRAVDQIDAMTDLAVLVSAQSEAARPTTDQAFSVWSGTALAEHRTTSAIELYSSNGRILSRFALNIPEYTSSLHIAPSCRWTTFEEVTSFAASDRHVLRATRGICTPQGMVGTIVVRVMLDYRTLPFISSQRPYIDPFAPEAQDAETTLGRDIEFTVYGWSRAPLYTFGGGVWPFLPETFDSLVSDRDPQWATVVRDDGRAYRIYYVSDRGGIYALGYPVITLFGHLLNVAELVLLTGILWALLLVGATLFNALTSRTPASGRALLREVRSSFYRKLWLAFVGAAIVPVLILAVSARTYFANQFSASVKDDAVRTATVAQRLVEDYAALQPRQAGTLEALDDQVMILVSQAIDQDVNLFDPKRLQATSQPDLFTAGVLPRRTPDDVYRAIVLNRLPTFVGEEAVGRASYLLAAARVRAGQREGIVTVPLTLRAQEADQQIDNLDRQVLFGFVLFVMLGAGIGYWMAERIADPVNRLTRATRRIARGDLDARIAATSSDELRRLVEDFNHMAADLKRQRAELERTQRIEAWADMARQVAHDIKNPLTPIQLSAEHARRVNDDRGRPLSPVLDECVTAILTQVKLLRQISVEFSNFASSPTPRPEPTILPPVIEEAINPYRAGLSGRVTVNVWAEPNLPAVSIDRTLFSRALTNLVENALFAMPGGGTLTVSTRRQAVNGRLSLVVAVSDTGAGMDKDALARLFEPYFSTKATGTGLGLTIAKRNVELSGGTIQVESERGIGTTVTIMLPIG